MYLRCLQCIFFSVYHKIPSLRSDGPLRLTPGSSSCPHAPMLSGARNPRQIFLFRFSMDISAVFHLYSQGGRIILMDAQKNFILRNFAFCDLKYQPQPFCGVSPPPVFRSDPISDMAGAISQKIILRKSLRQWRKLKIPTYSPSSFSRI